MSATCRRFRQKFKAGLCREVIDSSKTAATEYDVGTETLHDWLKKYTKK